MIVTSGRPSLLGMKMWKKSNFRVCESFYHQYPEQIFKQKQQNKTETKFLKSQAILKQEKAKSLNAKLQTYQNPFFLSTIDQFELNFDLYSESVNVMILVIEHENGLISYPLTILFVYHHF